MSTPQGLTDIEVVALAKAIKSDVLKKARSGVEPGEYRVSLDCHVEGTLRVGADYQTTVPAKAKPWNLVAALMTELEKMYQAAGMSGLDIKQLVAMAEAVDPNMAKEAERRAKEAIASIKTATTTVAKGRVTANLKVKALSDR